MHFIDYRIGGICLRIEMDTWISWINHSHFHSFVQEKANPDVILRFSCVNINLKTPNRINQQIIAKLSQQDVLNQYNLKLPIFGSAQVQGQIKSIIGHLDDVKLEIKPSSIVIFDFTNCVSDLFFLCSNGNDYSRSQVGSSLFAPYLTKFNATMVHSAGLIMAERAVIIMAPDEGGKTTVAELSERVRTSILSDDQVIIRKEGGEFTAHGTPWSRYTDGPVSAPLGGMFLLEKADHFELLPLKTIDAIDYLWNEHQVNWHFLPKDLRIKAFDLLLEICHTAPLYRMRFPQDYVDWDAVTRAVVK